jgi:hypothetical protein
MTDSTFGKKEMTAPESMQLSTSKTGKKHWHSPELMEVDYDKTNSAFSGFGEDFGFYS